MSLSLERAEGGRRGLGEGSRRVLCGYQLSLLPGQAFPGTGGEGGVRESGRLAGPVAVCPDSGLHISLSVCRRPSPTTPTPAQVMSKQLG